MLQVAWQHLQPSDFCINRFLAHDSLGQACSSLFLKAQLQGDLLHALKFGNLELLLALLLLILINY